MAELHGPLHEGGGKSGLTGKHISIPMVAGIVVVGGILAFVMMRGGSSHAGASSGTGGQVNPSSVNTNDAMALSEQMRGIQANTSNMFSDIAAKMSAGQTPAASTNYASVTLGGTPGAPSPSGGDIWSTMVATYGSADKSKAGTNIPFGNYKLAGDPANGLYPIYGPGGGVMYALQQNVHSYNPGAVAPVGRGAGPYLIASGPTANA